MSYLERSGTSVELRKCSACVTKTGLNFQQMLRKNKPK